MKKKLLSFLEVSPLRALDHDLGNILYILAMAKELDIDPDFNYLESVNTIQRIRNLIFEIDC